MGRYAKLDQYTQEEKEFWDRLCTCEGKTFTTHRGLEFTFSVRGNELFFDRKAKSITRATVMQAYRIAMRLVKSGVAITGPKKIGVFGASYLLPIFKQLEIV